MKIKNAIVHLLEKEKNSATTLKLRSDELDCTSPELEKLMQQVIKLYNEKTGRGYGVFHADTNSYPLSNLLSNHLNQGVTFIYFTHNAMHNLKSRIDTKHFATGGYVLFIKYEHNSNEALAIISLKHKPGFTFNDDLELAGQQHIDLEHLHEMARIDITKWTANEERYLSFAKRRQGNNEFSEYFREFIGCDEFSDEKTMTKTLIEAVKKFSQRDGIDEAKGQLIRQVVHDYCDEKAKSNEAISILRLSTLLNEDDPEEFTRFVNESDITLSDGFRPDKSIYKHLQRIQLKSKSITLSFDADMLDDSVIYNKNDGTLLIKELPDAFKRELASR
jgi:nucleoid-associated protein